MSAATSRALSRVRIAALAAAGTGLILFATTRRRAPASAEAYPVSQAAPLPSARQAAALVSLPSAPVPADRASEQVLDEPKPVATEAAALTGPSPNVAAVAAAPTGWPRPAPTAEAHAARARQHNAKAREAHHKGAEGGGPGV